MRRIDLANQLQLSPSGITRLLDRLEDQGLVGKGACKEDARVSYAILTDAGHEQAREAAAPGTSRTSSAAWRRSSSEDEMRTLSRAARPLHRGDRRRSCTPDE